MYICFVVGKGYGVNGDVKDGSGRGDIDRQLENRQPDIVDHVLLIC